ncbi:hypothetical protein NQ317_003242 [Molorchus minor]|uniref:NHR domain-containing protein n=1 Tax=Molorchus minor TaxID=1323400 RepID=A0ABQ9J7W4_9CUCU|nr:hypothetical protein NQ317_003242 [Molorchus minor]
MVERTSLNESGRLTLRCKDFNSCVVFSATPLVSDEMFEVSVTQLWKHMAGTLSVGVTGTPPALCGNVMPNDSYYLTESPQVLLPPPPNSVVTALLTFLDTRFEMLCEPYWLHIVNLKSDFQTLDPEQVIECCYHVNEKAFTVVLDQEEAPDLVDCGKDGASELNNSKNATAIYEFHDNHGRNIELGSGRTVARRVASYNQGVVVVQPH